LYQSSEAAESVKSFISGGFGGAAAVLVGKPFSTSGIQWSLATFAGHPFDLTKTRIQTAAPGVYTGAVDVVRKTLARDGITGYVVSMSIGIFVLTRQDSLYRGMVPPLLGVTPIFAISFWVGYPCIIQRHGHLRSGRTLRLMIHPKNSSYL
jgi:solute carrier family 25 carnitine/acylcarnitine transporter 20/29